MFRVRGTKKFLDRAGRPDPDPPASSTVLGDWYANVLFWRPQVALFVNASTFVPVLMPLAPASGVVGRFPAAMAEVFAVLGIDSRFVEAERSEMASVVLAKTASRQVLGVMNEFVFLAEAWRERAKTDRTSQVDVLLDAIVANQSTLSAVVAAAAERPTVSDGLFDRGKSGAGERFVGVSLRIKSGNLAVIDQLAKKHGQEKRSPFVAAVLAAYLA